jgi:hypothetical protein
MSKIYESLHEFFTSARTYIFFSTVLTGAVALKLLDQQQSDAILKAAIEIGIAFFGGTWTYSVGHRDVGAQQK